MIDFLTLASVIAAIALFLLGLVEYVRTFAATKDVKDATANAAARAKEVNASAAALEQQSAIDLKGHWEALAALATALKDLDRSTRFFLLSLAFLAVGGTTLGLDAIGTGLGPD